MLQTAETAASLFGLCNKSTDSVLERNELRNALAYLGIITTPHEFEVMLRYANASATLALCVRDFLSVKYTRTARKKSRSMRFHMHYNDSVTKRRVAGGAW